MLFRSVIQHLLYLHRNNPNYYKINKKNAEESMFKIQINNGWDSNKIIDDIINKNDWSDIYAVKLIGGNRKATRNFIFECIESGQLSISFGEDYKGVSCRKLISMNPINTPEAPSTTNL